MRFLIITITLILVSIIQATLVQYISILGIKPNMILIMIISFSLSREYMEAGVIGFFAGLLLDILTGKMIGLHTLLGMYTGLLVGNTKEKFFKDSYIVTIFFTFTFTFSYELIFYILNYFIWGETRMMYALSHIILLQSIYNAILSIPIYSLIIKVNNCLDKNEKAIGKYRY